jgi:hypothetical protein
MMLFLSSIEMALGGQHHFNLFAASQIVLLASAPLQLAVSQTITERLLTAKYPFLAGRVAPPTPSVGSVPASSLQRSSMAARLTAPAPPAGFSIQRYCSDQFSQPCCEHERRQL